MGDDIVVMPEEKAMLDEKVSSGFIWSIVSLVFCGCGLLGLIFSIIANKKVKKAIADGASLEDKKLKTAKIMAKIALIISIVAMVVWLIYGIIMGIAAAAFASQAMYSGDIMTNIPIG